MAEPCKIEGWCPLALCFEDGPHEHPVCDTCGAVNYGALDCPECREKGPAIRLAAIARARELGYLAPRTEN